MSDADADKYLKSVTTAIDGMFADLQKIAKQIADAAAAAEKAEAARAAAEEKAQADQQKRAEAAAEAARKKVLTLPPPVKLDPAQAIKIPDLILKHIDKNGVKLGDTISVKPDVDFDVKKMQLKKFMLEVTITF